MRISRRNLVTAACAPLLGVAGRAEPAAVFKVALRNGGWWFIRPDGRPMVSLGVNHLEPTLMLAPYNREATLKRYGADFVKEDGTFHPEGAAVRKWIQQVLADLADWGFNSLGFHNPRGCPNPC